MLINAQTREELRVAIVDGPTLEDFQVEVVHRGQVPEALGQPVGYNGGLTAAVGRLLCCQGE